MNDGIDVEYLHKKLQMEVNKNVNAKSENSSLKMKINEMTKLIKNTYGSLSKF
jgi:predicted HAD superfamily Cof-like phosphohydrolase